MLSELTRLMDNMENLNQGASSNNTINVSQGQGKKTVTGIKKFDNYTKKHDTILEENI